MEDPSLDTAVTRELNPPTEYAESPLLSTNNISFSNYDCLADPHSPYQKLQSPAVCDGITIDEKEKSVHYSKSQLASHTSQLLYEETTVESSLTSPTDGDVQTSSEPQPGDSEESQTKDSQLQMLATKAPIQMTPLVSGEISECDPADGKDVLTPITTSHGIVQYTQSEHTKAVVGNHLECMAQPATTEVKGLCYM